MYGQHGTAETYQRGREYELRGLKLLRAAFPKERVRATVSGSLEDRRGTDVYVGDKSVDIKGLKNHAKDGQLLVEHTNVSGGPGWSTKSNGFVLIFVNETDALLVNKKFLALLVGDPRKFDWTAPATRQPREFVENFKPYGRPENLDRVAYVPYAQLWKLKDTIRINANQDGTVSVVR